LEKVFVVCLELAEDDGLLLNKFGVHGFLGDLFFWTKQNNGTAINYFGNDVGTD